MESFQRVLGHRQTFAFFLHPVGTFPRAGILPASQAEKSEEDLEGNETDETRESCLEVEMVFEVDEK